MERMRAEIREEFLFDLFGLSQTTKRMTTTEVLAQLRERANLSGPTLGKYETHFFAPLVERELDILGDLDVLPEAPAGVSESVDLQFQSPLTRLMQSEEMAGIDSLIQAASQLAPFDQERVRATLNVDELLRRKGYGSGVPLDGMNTREAVASEMERMQGEEQARQLGEVAPALAGAAKDLAQAQQIAGE
jgi:hypothetical protein